MSPLLVGVVFGVGILLVYDALVRPERPARTNPRRAMPSTSAFVGAALGGAIALVFSGWPVAGVAGAIAGAKLPSAVARSRAERARIARREALAALATRLRDAIRSGIGLSDALQQAAANAPEVIAPALRRLVGVAQVEGLAAAADAFAAEVDDPSAGLLAAALGFADRLGSRNLAEVLDSLAEATAAQAATVREARARQTRARTSARIVAAVPLILLVVIRRTNPAYLEPYKTGLGQAVLAFGLGLIAFGYQVMRRMARLEGAR